MHDRLGGGTDSYPSHREDFQRHVMCSYYVFHEFGKVIGKTNIKDIVRVEMRERKPYVQNLTSCLDSFCPEFWAPSGMAPGIPCFLHD